MPEMKKPMTVLFLANAKSIHTIRWVNALAKRGHSVHVVSNADHCAESGTLEPQIQQHILPFPTQKGLGYFLNRFALKKLLDVLKFDVVNAHYASGYGTLARLSGAKPLVLSVWGSDVYDFPYDSSFKKSIIISNLKYADAIASTSIAMKEQVLRLFPQAEVTVTPFGVDLELFRPFKKKEDKDIIIFGTVKTLAPKYGIRTLIDAYAIVKEKTDKKTKLLIYGDGEECEDLNEYIRELNLEESVTLKGAIPNNQVPEALDEMDIFLLGSVLNSESFGVSAVEAMAMRLPVIATAVDGFKEVMADNETGFLVPIKDHNKMAEKMIELMNNPQLSVQMGYAGRRRVEALYNFESNVTAMEKLYHNVIGTTK